MIGQRQRAEMLNWLLGLSPATPGLLSSLYLDLYTADPGEQGDDAVAITGGGYAPAETTAATWAAATYGDPTACLNDEEIEWPAAAGDWAGAAEITHVAAWKHATDRSEENYVGRFELVTPRQVLTGQTFSFPVGAIQFRLSSGGYMDLTAVETKLDTLHADLDSVQTKLDTLHADVDGVETALATLHTDLDGVETKLDTLHSDAVPPTAGYYGSGSVGTTAAQIASGASQALTRGVRLQNIHATQLLYWGFDNSVNDTNGFRLLPGESAPIPIDNRNKLWLYGSAASTTYRYFGV